MGRIIIWIIDKYTVTFLFFRFCVFCFYTFFLSILQQFSNIFMLFGHTLFSVLFGSRRLSGIQNDFIGVPPTRQLANSRMSFCFPLTSVEYSKSRREI